MVQEPPTIYAAAPAGVRLTARLGRTLMTDIVEE